LIGLPCPPRRRGGFFLTGTLGRHVDGSDERA
jgi:hypothetical protein